MVRFTGQNWSAQVLTPSMVFSAFSGLQHIPLMVLRAQVKTWRFIGSFMWRLHLALGRLGGGIAEKLTFLQTLASQF